MVPFHTIPTVISITDFKSINPGNVVLTWISIYWFSRAGAGATTRIYHEIFGDADEVQDLIDPYKRPQDVPFGVSRFPKERVLIPKAYVLFPP